MPELPEVETVKNVLKPHLVGRKISAAVVNNGAVIARPAAEKFAECVQGRIFSDFTRRGKFLTLHFFGGDRIVLHLRMTGSLTIEPKDVPCEKHTHLIFRLDDGNELRYEDTRRFGKFWYIENGAVDEFSGKSKLGREPFDLSAEYLHEKLCSSKKPVKELLLDQSIIAGIGNIYSDEICFAAKIPPYRAGNTLTEKEIRLLCETIPERLGFFIEKNRMTFEDYAIGKGKDYRNAPYLQVYGKKGAPCPLCGNSLTGKTIGGRSSVFCPVCQGET